MAPSPQYKSCVLIDFILECANEILHEIFRVVSYFPRYILCYFFEKSTIFGTVCTAV